MLQIAQLMLKFCACAARLRATQMRQRLFAPRTVGYLFDCDMSGGELKIAGWTMTA
jgi:hypothetical protein